MSAALADGADPAVPPPRRGPLAYTMAYTGLSRDVSEPTSPIEGIASICLDDPARANALSNDLIEHLDAALRSAQRSGNSVLVLQGHGVHFSAGFDLSPKNESSTEIMARFIRIEKLLDLVRSIPCLTVAVVQGAAIGAGADLAQACDYRFGMVDSGLSFRFPGFQFGVALGTRRLIETVGRERARDLLLTARKVGETEAKGCGLVSHVGTRPELEELIAHLASAAEGLGPTALARLLRLTRPQPGAADLAELVESVSRDDIAGAVHGYAARSSRARDVAEKDRREP